MRRSGIHHSSSRELAHPSIPGTFPREETLIARILTGRVGTPDNFNQWVGWKHQDRGVQNLATEPLWSVDFATGEIVNGVASGDPTYNEDFTKITIPLREGVAWSDGEPFTSADVREVVISLDYRTADDSAKIGHVYIDDLIFSAKIDFIIFCIR